MAMDEAHMHAVPGRHVSTDMAGDILGERVSCGWDSTGTPPSFWEAQKFF
jgi:hypothetical protein